MKYGYRIPNIKKSVSARTTGKINRSINKTINPLYEKKGMGYINNPEKAIYNKIYNQTTKNIIDKETKMNIFVWVVILIIAIPFIWMFIKFFSWLFE